MSDTCESKLRRGAALAAATLVGLAGFGAPGCVKQQATTSKPPPVKLSPSTAKPEANLDTRVSQLRKQSADLSAVTHSLPGSTPAETRDKVRQAFTLLTQILPRLELVPTGGVYDHQLTVVELTRTTLATSSRDLSINPVVDRGLRATYNALDDAQHSRYYDQDTQLRGTLDQLSAKIPELDRTHGPEHDLVWAEVFNLTSDAVSRMVGSLADRLAGTPPGEPTTAPAAAPELLPPPATAPTEATPPIAPATAPATAPTTAPAGAP